MALPDNERVSPLEGLSHDRFKGHTMATEFTVDIRDTRLTLLRNNPNRVHWIVTNEGLNDVRVSFDPSISFSSGFILAASGGVIIVHWEDEGEATGYEVFAISNAVGSRVRVREVTIL